MAKKIIKDELAGVFNWILKGLERLLDQKNFTYSEIVNEQLEQYKKYSDTVQLFLEEENYVKSIDKTIMAKDFLSGIASIVLMEALERARRKPLMTDLIASGLRDIEKILAMFTS